MNKEVLVRIKGLQNIDMQEEAIEMIVPGEYYFRNGNHFIKYDEISEDTHEKTVNIIKLTREMMQVRKKGGTNTSMVFESRKKTETYYKTVLGSMQMGIATTKIEFVEAEDQLDVNVNYALELNREHIADCRLNVNVRDRKNSAAAGAGM
ncbi:MAG: DUF1934 domain-containing protein [Lachnospiraceae bacterium]